MLNIGDKIFLSDYGAGVVLDIESKNFLNCEKEYIIIYMILYDMDLLIPIDNIGRYNVRMISDKDEIENELNLLKDTPTKIEENWNKRYRKNRNKIATGNLKDMFEVLRQLYYLKSKEELPVGEEKILEKVEGLLASEIMLLYGICEDEAFRKLKIDK